VNPASKRCQAMLSGSVSKRTFLPSRGPVAVLRAHARMDPGDDLSGEIRTLDVKAGLGVDIRRAGITYSARLHLLKLAPLGLFDEGPNKEDR